MHLKSPEQQAGWVVFIIFFMLMVALGILTHHFRVYAEDISYLENVQLVSIEQKDEKNDVSLEMKLYSHIMNQMVMCRKSSDGGFIYHQFCREDLELCQKNMWHYANNIVKYAKQYDLDVWTFAAVALHESFFNAYLVGKKKERGIFQLLPYSPVGKKSKFANNGQYRKFCKTQVGHCQEEVIQLAASYLRNSIEACNDSLEAGLTAYNSGKCTSETKRYVHNVKEKLVALKENKMNIRYCSGEQI